MSLGRLVICVGNPFRGDDGIGPAVAARLGDLGVPNDSVLVCTGLLPELAGQVAEAEAVLFVDASAEGPPGDVRIRAIAPARHGSRWTHQLSPQELLALASALCGQAPPASLVTVGGQEWDFGTGLSAAIESSVNPIAALVATWWTSRGPAEKPPRADNSEVAPQADNAAHAHAVEEVL